MSVGSVALVTQQSGLEYPAAPGDVHSFACALPTGWLACDGSSLLRASYPALFAKIGTTWGSADATHFNVPDLRGRSVIGSGTGSGLTARTLGTQNIGAETVALSTAELAAHTHGAGTLVNANESAHTHPGLNVGGGAVKVVMDAAAGAVRRNIAYTAGDGTGNEFGVNAGSAHTHTISGSTSSSGSGTAHNNMQPSAVINWGIKT